MSNNILQTILTSNPLICEGRILDHTLEGKPQACFSLRKTKSDYKGPCLRIRRTSDNTEKDIYFLQTDLDTPTLLQFVNGYDGYVTVWFDQSGRQHHATQPNMTIQPQLVIKGRIIVDTGSNQPAIRFNGSYLVTNWTPTLQQINKSGIFVTGSSGITVLDDNRVIKDYSTRQPGIVREYPKAGLDVRTNYPNELLEQGHDSFLFESYPVNSNATKVIYPEGSTYKRLNINDVGTLDITKDDTGITIQNGPISLSIDKVIPKQADGVTDLYDPAALKADQEYNDIVLSGNGYLYTIPYKSNIVLRLDEDNASGESEAKQIHQVTEAGVTTERYWSGISWPGKGIYCIPYNASEILFIDESDDTQISTLALPSPQTGLKNIGLYRKAVKTTNAIYCIPYNASYVLKIDPSTNTTSHIGPDLGQGDSKYWDADVVEGTEAIIAPPFSAGSIMVIDGSSDTVSFPHSTGARLEILGTAGGLTDWLGHAQINYGGRGYLIPPTVSCDAPQIAGGSAVQGTTSIQKTAIMTDVALVTSQPTSEETRYGVYQSYTVEGGFGYIEDAADEVNFPPVVAVVYTEGRRTGWPEDWRWANRRPIVEVNLIDDGEYDDGTISTKKIGSVDILDAGDGLTFDRKPYIHIVGGKGRPAQVQVLISRGQVTGILIKDKGSGYWDKQNLKVIIEGGRPATEDTTAYAEAKVTKFTHEVENNTDPWGGIYEIEMIQNGRDYDANKPPTIKIIGGKGMEARFESTNSYSAKVTEVSIPDIANGGTGYAVEGPITTYAEAEAFVNNVYKAGNAAITISPPSKQPTAYSPSQTNRFQYPEAIAYIKAVDGDGAITSIGLISTGAGYIIDNGSPEPVTVTIGGNASGAQVTIAQDGRVSKITTTDPGNGYIRRPVTVEGGTTYYGVKLNGGRGSSEVDQATPGPIARGLMWLEGPCYSGSPYAEHPYNHWPSYATNGYRKFSRCIAVGQKVFAFPYDTYRVLVLNWNSSNNAIDPPEDILLDPLYNKKDITLRLTTGKFLDAVYNNNPTLELIFGIPYSFEKVLVVDVRSESLSFISPGTQTTLNYDEAKRFLGEWTSGALFTRTGMIFACPGTSNALLSLDGRDPQKSELKVFQNITGPGRKFSKIGVSSQNMFYFANYDAKVIAELNPGIPLRSVSLPAVGVSLLDQNQIVFAPRQTTNPYQGTEMVIIDTSTNPYTSLTITNTINANTSYTDAVVCNGNVFFVPTYNITDPFSSKNWIAKYNPSGATDDEKLTFVFQVDVATSRLLAPYPSRAAYTDEGTPLNPLHRLFWVPRGPTTNAFVYYDENGANDDIELGIRSVPSVTSAVVAGKLPNPDSQPTIPDATGIIPTPTSVIEFIGGPYWEFYGLDAPGWDETKYAKFAGETDLVSSVGYGWQTSSAAVDAYGRVVIFPATYPRITEGNETTHIVQILYPDEPDIEFAKIEDASSDSQIYPQVLVPEGGVNLLKPTIMKIPREFLREYTGGMLYGGAALGIVDQQVYAVPFNKRKVLAVDTFYYTMQEYEFDLPSDLSSSGVADPNDPELLYGELSLWRGLVDGGNNKLYGIPWNANYIIEISPGEPNPTLKCKLIGPIFDPPENNFSSKWWGGCLAQDGKIYCAPYAASSILVITPGVGVTQTSFTMNDFGNPTVFTNRSWSGAALGINASVYCAPYSSDSILKIDVETQTLTLIETNLIGGSQYRGVACGGDGHLYFSPYNQNSILDFDPLTDSFNRLGSFEYPSSRLTFETSDVVPLTNGSIISLSAYHPVALYIAVERKLTFTFDYNQPNSDRFIVGKESKRGYVLRPYIISPDPKTQLALYHNGNGFSVYNTSADRATQPYTPMIDGPEIQNGISTFIRDTDGLEKLIVVKDDTVTVMTPFVGGMMGQRTVGSDLNLIVSRDSLNVNIGNATSTTSTLFRTVFKDAQSGVFAGVSDASRIYNYIRDSPVVTTPYGVDSTPPADVFTIGRVSGSEVGTQGSNAVFVGQLSEIIVFGNSDAPTQNVSQYANNQDFYFKSTVNDYINETNYIN
jgi:hypothetical protein